MRRACIHVPIAILLVLVAAHGSAVGGKPNMETGLSYKTLETGKDSAFSERKPSLRLFTDTDTFNRFYTDLHENQIPVPEPPDTDFDGNFVVYVSFGQKNTGGYSIEVLGVFTERDGVVVKARLRQPPPGSFQVQVLTHPYAILSIAGGALKGVDFVDERGNRLDSAPFR